MDAHKIQACECERESEVPPDGAVTLAGYETYELAQWGIVDSATAQIPVRCGDMQYGELVTAMPPAMIQSPALTTLNGLPQLREYHEGLERLVKTKQVRQQSTSMLSHPAGRNGVAEDVLPAEIILSLAMSLKADAAMSAGSEAQTTLLGARLVSEAVLYLAPELRVQFEMPHRLDETNSAGAGFSDLAVGVPNAMGELTGVFIMEFQKSVLPVKLFGLCGGSHF